MNDDLTSFRLEQPNRTGERAGEDLTGRYTPWRSIHSTHGHFSSNPARQGRSHDGVFTPRHVPAIPSRFSRGE